MQCSTTEPQEHAMCLKNTLFSTYCAFLSLLMLLMIGRIPQACNRNTYLKAVSQELAKLNSLCAQKHCKLLFQVQDTVLCIIRCTHSNIWVLFWNNVVNITEPLISSCVLFWIPNKVVYLSQRHTVSPDQHYSRNNSSAFFNRMCFWAELCKSPHTVM